MAKRKRQRRSDPTVASAPPAAARPAATATEVSDADAGLATSKAVAPVAPPAAGPAPASRQALVAGIIGAAAVLGVAGLTIWRSGRPAAPALPPPAAAPPTAGGLERPPGRPGESEPGRVLAHVGPREIRSGDVTRYTRFKQLTLGIASERRALTDLCDRSLLVLAAAERALTVSDAELAQDLARRKLVMGAFASPSPLGAGGGFGSVGGMGLPGGRPGIGGPFGGGLPGAGLSGVGPFGGSPSPGGGEPGFGPRGLGSPGGEQPLGDFASPADRADQMLRQAGLTPEEFAAEVKDEAVAARLRQVLVYDPIAVSEADLAAAYRDHEKRAASQPAPPPLTTRLASGSPQAPKGAGATAAAAAKSREAAVRASLRQRLQRERGAKPLAELMEKLRAKFPIRIL